MFDAFWWFSITSKLVRTFIFYPYIVDFSLNELRNFDKHLILLYAYMKIWSEVSA